MGTGTWRTSSYSGSGGGACVEVRLDRRRRVHVRDSVHPHLAELALPRWTWVRLIAALRGDA